MSLLATCFDYHFSFFDGNTFDAADDVEHDAERVGADAPAAAAHARLTRASLAALSRVSSFVVSLYLYLCLAICFATCCSATPPPLVALATSSECSSGAR